MNEQSITDRYTLADLERWGEITRRSSATMSRIKSEGRSFSVVIVANKTIGERADRQLS